MRRLSEETQRQPLPFPKIQRTAGLIMKKILLALLLVSNAYAEDWFEGPNKANGKIVLLTLPCTQRPDATTLKLMYSTGDSGKTLWGCWNYWSGAVHVVYDAGDTYTYPPELFTYKQSK